MEIDELLGLPAHPMLVHVPVVVLPLAAIGALLIAVVPGWRARFGWVVLVLAGIAALGTQLAYGSGDPLLDRIEGSEAIDKHIDLARTTRPLVLVFFALTAVFVIGGARLPALRTDTRRPAALALGAVLVVSAGFATVWMVRTGHQGGSAVWRGTGE